MANRSRETIDTSSDFLNPSTSILPINELSTSISDFLQQLDIVAECEIERIVEGRKHWEKEVDEVEEKNNYLGSELRKLKNKDKLFAEEQVKEMRSITKLKSEIANLKKDQEEAKFAIDDLKLRIELKREAIVRKREERAEALAALQLQRKRNQLKLNAYEDSTCMRIYGAQEDKITFIFTQIREDKPHREHAFTVDVSQGQYQVSECLPRLKELDRIVEWVNTSEDFYTFLKKMRNSFRKNYTNRT